VPKGATLSLDTMWTLTVPWYASRMDYNWMPRTPETIERLFADAGLTGKFWDVR